MRHKQWEDKTLGDFIEYISREHSYAIGFYSINNRISLEEVIGLCIYDSKYIDKYYNMKIISIEGSDYEYSIEVR